MGRKSQWRRYMWRGHSSIVEKTGVKFVNLGRKEFGERMRQTAQRVMRRLRRVRSSMANGVDIFPQKSRICDRG
jgi:IS1 family transposase